MFPFGSLGAICWVLDVLLGVDLLGIVFLEDETLRAGDEEAAAATEWVGSWVLFGEGQFEESSLAFWRSLPSPSVKLRFTQSLNS